MNGVYLYFVNKLLLIDRYWDFNCWDKILLNSSWKMLLSSPTRLIQFYLNSYLMTDPTYHIRTELGKFSGKVVSNIPVM